jgi:hypothetical protein
VVPHQLYWLQHWLLVHVRRTDPPLPSDTMPQSRPKGAGVGFVVPLVALGLGDLLAATLGLLEDDVEAAPSQRPYPAQYEKHTASPVLPKAHIYLLQHILCQCNSLNNFTPCHWHASRHHDVNLHGH